MIVSIGKWYHAVENNYTRDITHRILGFVRITHEHCKVGVSFGDTDRVLRVLNDEPEPKLPTLPERKLNDKHPAREDIFGVRFFDFFVPRETGYIFKTEELKAEIARRKKADK